MGTHSWYSSMDGEHGGDCAMSAWKCEYVFSFILVVVEKEKEVSVSEVLKVERWHKQTSCSSECRSCPSRQYDIGPCGFVVELVSESEETAKRSGKRETTQFFIMTANSW